MQQAVVDLLDRTGPLTGAEIHRALGGEVFRVWQACRPSPRIESRRVGRRYLRFDRQVDGFARLSPSILREFLTYTVVGRAGDPAVEHRAGEVRAHITEVSRQKRDLAARLITEIAGRFGDDTRGGHWFCAVLAGDIVYDMAHDVDRPERSTGVMVRGSDLDIVVVVRDAVPEELVAPLDRAIYEQKAYYLRGPAFREEIDYVVKRFTKLEEQTRFDTFPRMVACKIFDESVLLGGSPDLFAAGKALLAGRGIVRRLRDLEQSARRAREQLEETLLTADEPTPARGGAVGFYSHEETAEFE